MKTRLLLLVIVVACFCTGLLLTSQTAQASGDGCNHNCAAIVCGGACTPGSTVPPVQLYRCYTAYGPVDCEGQYTCGCTLIGCSSTGFECGW